MTPLRAANEFIIMLLAYIIITFLIFLFANKFTHAEDYLSGKLIVDFPKEEARYTESHSFGVQMSAGVPENSCNRCLRDNSGSACLEECSDVLLTY